MELRALGMLQSVVLLPVGRGPEATARLEEVARERIGKPLAELAELLPALRGGGARRRVSEHGRGVEEGWPRFGHPNWDFGCLHRFKLGS